MNTKQSALQVCRECGAARPVYDTRNVEIVRRGLKTVVPAVSGWFCGNCEEIEFDESTDSLHRWAAAGDALVLRDRERAKRLGERLRRQRQKLNLTQIDASILAGGGHNAFSRYETGSTLPVAAVTTLFGLLEKHPELVEEARSLAQQVQAELQTEDVQG
ncbi:MAG TPA: type II toxin-antitoxin system MqsA family antitoxin [Ramlibacter sp.]|nr:type II toxin-antitoxin system MqsA family antitoxin [Ramlibacter sp.]